MLSTTTSSWTSCHEFLQMLKWYVESPHLSEITVLRLSSNPPKTADPVKKIPREINITKYSLF